MESTRFFLPRDWRAPPNEQSELFALGSTIYYILTSYVPYEDLADDEVMVKYERKKFPNVEDLPCGRAIEGCWIGDFKSAEDVLRAILEDGRLYDWIGSKISKSRPSGNILMTERVALTCFKASVQYRGFSWNSTRPKLPPTFHVWTFTDLYGCELCPLGFPVLRRPFRGVIV